MLVAKDNVNSIGAGVALWLVAIITGSLSLWIFMMGDYMMGDYPYMASFQVGAWQWLLLLPMILYFRSRQMLQTVKGIVIGACIAMLLNAMCFVYVFCC